MRLVGILMAATMMVACGGDPCEKASSNYEVCFEDTTATATGTTEAEDACDGDYTEAEECSFECAADLNSADGCDDAFACAIGCALADLAASGSITIE